MSSLRIWRQIWPLFFFQSNSIFSGCVLVKIYDCRNSDKTFITLATGFKPFRFATFCVLSQNYSINLFVCQVFNASLNFPIYYLMGTAFRKSFHALFGIKKPHSPRWLWTPGARREPVACLQWRRRHDFGRKMGFEPTPARVLGNGASLWAEHCRWLFLMHCSAEKQCQCAICSAPYLTLCRQPSSFIMIKILANCFIEGHSP